MTTIKSLEKQFETLKKKANTKPHIENINKLTNFKSEVNNRLNTEKTKLNDLKLEYKNQRNNILLKTNFNDEIKGKVTNELKNAYIDNKLSELLSDINDSENTISALETYIDTINEYIDVEKTKIKLILK